MLFLCVCVGGGGGQNFELYYFGGFELFQLFLGYVSLCGYSFGYVSFGRYLFRGQFSKYCVLYKYISKKYFVMYS